MVITSQLGDEKAYIGVIGLDGDGRKETIRALPEGGRFGTGGWQYSASDRIVGRGPLLGNGRDQLVIQTRRRDTVAIVGLSSEGVSETYAVVRAGERFGGGWKVNPGDEVICVGRFMSSERGQILIRSRGYLGVVGLSADGEPETGPVIPGGGQFGDDGWKWQHGHSVHGPGNFVDNGREQFVVHEGQDMAIVEVKAGKFVTVDSTVGRRPLSKLAEVWEIGDFAGLGNDQVFGKERGGANYLKLLSFENPKLDDKGNWRDGRFVINADTGVFTSTLYYLQQYIGERGDRRSFPDFWRDFTITNKTKDMTGTPVELRYSMKLSSELVPVASESYPLTSSRRSIQRWAANYLEVVPERGARSVRFRAGVTSAPFSIYWTVVVAGSGGELKSVSKERTRSFDARVALDPGDKATLIVSTLWANVEVEFEELVYAT